MDSPTTRVLGLLELLQAHGHLSGPELARRLGIEGRSLRRYIGKLEELGIPVFAERGRYVKPWHWICQVLRRWAVASC